MQIDKQLVRDHFSKASGTYEKSAGIQYSLAKRLNSMIDLKDYQKVLEIGCGTGALTGLFVNSHSFSSLLLNDLSDSMLEVCWQKFKSDERITFLQADAENISEILDYRFSLIISNACFQWFKDLQKVLLSLKGMLEKDGTLIFSTFIEGNFQEIRNTAHTGLNYLDEKALRNCIAKAGLDYEMHINEEFEYFDNAKEMLRSFKNTGVTGITGSVMTRSQVLKFLNDYELLYRDEKGVRLTWKYAFIKAHLPD